MSSGLMFDYIGMNIFRNKVLKFHVKGVESYFTKIENNQIYMYRVSIQYFYCKNGTN